MANKIGDYIHLKWAGYQTWGSGKKLKTLSKDGGKTYTEEWGTYIGYGFTRKTAKNIKNKFGTQSSLEKIKEELQTVLNVLMQTLRNPNNENERKIVEDELKETFKEKLQDINWDTGEVTAKSSSFEQLAQIKGTQIINVKEISDKINDFEKIVTQKINADNVLTDEEIADLKQFIGEQGSLLKEYKEAYRKFALYDKVNKTKKGGTQYSSKEYRNLVKYREELNRYISKYAGYPNTNYQSGYMFESVFKILPRIAYNLGVDALTKGVRMLGTDVGRSTPQYNQKVFVEQVGNTLTKVTASRSKADIHFEWRGEDVSLSAKNINFAEAHQIGLVSGSPLLYMIQDLDTTFVNHFLNLWAEHYKKSSDGERFIKDTKVPSDMAIKKENIRNEMKYILLYKALTGDTFGQPHKANLLVINDRSSTDENKVKVFTIAEILKKIENNEKLINIPTLNNKMKLFKNNYVGNLNYADHDKATVRISNLLADAHERKISVALNIHTIK